MSSVVLALGLIVVLGFLLHELESTSTLDAHRAVTLQRETTFPLKIPRYVTRD